MKLYVAGASADFEACERYANVARELGFEIVCEWWKDVKRTRAAGLADRDLDHETRRDLATKDLCAVQIAHVLWLVCPPPDVHTTGAWCELGVAITSGVFVVVSGDHRQCLFTAKGTRIFDRHVDALEFLAGLMHDEKVETKAKAS